MVLLNTAAGTVSGCFGLSFLIQIIQRFIQAQNDVSQSSETEEDRKRTEERPLSTRESRIQREERSSLFGLGVNRKAFEVFRIWLFVFALVGAQMSWVLRPFIGHPDIPFTWFRAREGNFFLAVWKTIISFFAG